MDTNNQTKMLRAAAALGRRPAADVHLARGVAPVVPAAGDDDVVHVGVGEDDAGEGAPGAAEVERAGARHAAVEEGEPRVVQQALPALRRQRAVPRRHRVHVATLQPCMVTMLA